MIDDETRGLLSASSLFNLVSLILVPNPFVPPRITLTLCSQTATSIHTFIYIFFSIISARRKRQLSLPTRKIRLTSSSSDSLRQLSSRRVSPFPRPDPTSRSAALTRRHPPPLPPRALDRLQPPRRLNYRTVLTGKGIEVCDAGTYGLHLIARANRRAAAETWNVPQVRLPRAPPRALTPVTDHSLVAPCPPACAGARLGAVVHRDQGHDRERGGERGVGRDGQEGQADVSRAQRGGAVCIIPPALATTRRVEGLWGRGVDRSWPCILILIHVYML